MSTGPGGARERPRLRTSPFRVGCAAAGAVVLLAGVVASSGCGGPAGRSPAASPAAAGADLFRSRCQFCHGPAGGGGSGPSLLRARDDWAIRRVVRDGRGEMPAFAAQLTPAQIELLVAHVRRLGTGPDGRGEAGKTAP